MDVFVCEDSVDKAPSDTNSQDYDEEEEEEEEVESEEEEGSDPTKTAEDVSQAEKDAT